MKLTCCCGASIEDSPSQGYDWCSHDVVKFLEKHGPCILAWRRSVIMEVSPGCTPRSDNNGITNKKCRDFDAWVENMSSKALSRVLNSDNVARSTVMALWMGAQKRECDTQTMPHPNYYVNWRKRYQRFIDAVGNFGRVFHIVDGRLLATLTMIAYDGTAPPSEELFIEGVDVPMCPQFNWLEKNGVISTGECRVPNIGELFAAINTWNGQPRSVMLCEFCKRVIDDYWSFNGRRWILKRESEG